MCETLFDHLSIDKSTTNKNKPTAHRSMMSSVQH